MVPIKDKIKGTHLKWLGHTYIRSQTAYATNLKREKQVTTLNEIMKKDIMDCGVTKNMVVNNVDWNTEV